METFFDFSLTPQISGTDELYFRSAGFVSDKGVMTAERNDAEVSFDTYFNMIPSAKLREYTNAEKIVFTVCGKDIETEIFASNGYENIFLGNKMQIAVNDIPENAVYIYPVVRAKNSGAVLEGISVQLEGRTAHTDIALIICTYKREEYLIPNLEYLSRGVREKELDVQIIAVDNARSVSVSDVPDDVILIPNDNTGGSGGFGRGMAAAAEMDRFTHFILMDDDVKIDFVSLQKLAGFLRFRNEKHKDVSISGSMLYLDKPNIQFESGGRFEADGTQKGFGHFIDLTDRHNIFDNEQPKNANYGGWWFMCIPMKYVDEGNYPMPFFIKYDDVEYALRCRLEISTLNGVSVWHEPFEWKYNSSSEYYNMRNFLFLRLLTDSGFTKRQAKKIAHKQILEKLCRQQYKMAEAVKLGYEDFLKGIDYLRQINAEENHQRICSLNYEMLSLEEINKRCGIQLTEYQLIDGIRKSQSIKQKPIFSLEICGMWITPFRKKEKYIITDSFFDTKESYAYADKAVHWDQNINKGYMTKKWLLSYVFNRRIDKNAQRKDKKYVKK